MSNILTLDSMKDLSIEEIIRLYQLGYRIEDLAVDPVVNFGKVTVSTGYSSIATSIILNSGDGLKLPNPSTDGQFNLVWYNSTDYPDPSDDPNREIVRVTAKSTDTLTVIRNQEGTSASNKNTPTKTYKMILSPTAKMIPDIQTDAQSRVDTHSALSSGIHGAGTNYLALASGSQYTAVNKAGDTMTGTLNLLSNGLIVGTNQLIASGGNIGIGTTTPSDKLTISGGDLNLSASGTIGNINNIRNLGLYNTVGSYNSGEITGNDFSGQLAILGLGSGVNRNVVTFYTRDTGNINQERMRIDLNGYVGIGTTTPSRSLSIKADSNVYNIGFNDNTNSEKTNIYTVSTYTAWQSVAGNQIRIIGSNGIGITIADGGNVGIGTTTPSNLFTVKNPSTHTQIDLDSSAADRVSNLNFLHTGTYKWQISSRGTLDVPNNRLTVYNAVGSEVFTILQTGNIGIGIGVPTYQLQLSSDSAAKPGTNTWTISSDERIKKDIRPFTDGIDTIVNINPVWYKYNGKCGFKDDNIDHIGVIGQHIQEIAPYTINTYKAKLNEDDKEETELLNFNSHALTFVLINAMKEMKKEIDSLKDEIRTLKTAHN